MKVTIPAAKAASAEGITVVEGLYVSESGATEPIFILRASEPAAQVTMLAYMESIKRLGYRPQVVDQALATFARMQQWQLSEKGTTPRLEDERSEGMPKAAPAAEAKPVKGAKPKPKKK